MRMNHSQYLETRRALLAISGLLSAWPLLGRAQSAFDEGIDFSALRAPQPTQVKGRIEVIEFFWFACPHCYALEPRLNAWVKTLPKSVAFRREHVSFRGTVQQQLFYTLNALKLVEAQSASVFKTIHDRQVPLNTQDAVFAWARDQGIDMARFEKAWNSSEVVAEMKRATALMAAHEVDSVPRFTVQGRFVTSPAMAGGSQERVLQVLNFLIQKSRSLA